MDIPDKKEYAINWKNYSNHVRTAFVDLLSSEELTDVTLCCEGKRISAHKILLSACSGYFRGIFKDIPCQHPVVFLKGISYAVLADILRFIYNGEVNVDTVNLGAFLEAAQLLEIDGLTDTRNEENVEPECTKENTNMNKDKAKKGTKRKLPPETQQPSKSDVIEEIEPLPQIKTEINVDITNSDSQEDVIPCLPELSMDDSNTPEDQEKNCKEVLDLKYVCSICGKSYRSRDSLYKHSSVHTGGTQCPICSRILSRKTHLERHMLTNHGLNNIPNKPVDFTL